MLKKIFVTIGLIGVITISVMAFTVPIDPYAILPAMTIFSFDKPVWLCWLVGGNILYLIVLYFIYDKIKLKIEQRQLLYSCKS